MAKKLLNKELIENQANYWLDNLKESSTLLSLPTDYSRPSVQTYNGKSTSFVIPDLLLKKIYRLGKEEQVTLFMLLTATFNILLSKYSGQKDICIGTPIANRTNIEIEPLIGFFVNTLVLRTKIEDSFTFIDLLKQVYNTTLGAYANQDIPFEQVVDRIKPERHTSHSPLFQVMLALQNISEEEIFFNGLTTEFIPVNNSISKFDLTLTMVEGKDKLYGAFEYNTDLFDESTIDRMIGHFLRLLELVTDNPHCQIGDLSLLGPEEYNEIVVKWNDTGVDYPLSETIQHLFEVQAEKNPDHIAVVFEDKKLTYAELNKKANQLAYYLRTLGVGPDILVGICVERSLEMIIGLMAILKAGGAYVPLDPSYPLDRLAYMLNDANPLVLLTQSHLLESLPVKKDMVLLSIDKCDSIISEYQDSNLENINSPNDLAYVIYTSGSTGQPKGVAIEQEGIVNRLYWMQDAYDISMTDRVLHKASFSFDISLYEIFWPLLNGASLVLAKPEGHKDVSYLAELISQQNITVVQFVPPMLDAFLNILNNDYKHLLKQVLCGGDILSVELKDRFYNQFEGVELYNQYGPTEATIDAADWRCESSSLLNIVPIGRPISNTQIYLLDANLNPVPVGVPGELHIAGKGLARGYLNRPELTAEKFIPNPYSDEPGSRMYKTGDLARYLPDGLIEYLGRIDHQVKIRGFRIELGEIESQLSQRPDVREVVVLAYESLNGEKA